MRRTLRLAKERGVRVGAHPCDETDNLIIPREHAAVDPGAVAVAREVHRAIAAYLS
jgi:lactam utilization protein B